MTNMQFIREAIGAEDEKGVKVRILHGYWQADNESRKIMEEGVWGSNVQLISVYLHDPFGTHHSKIIVIFRNDDTAQVAVQTGLSLSVPADIANMIPFDHGYACPCYLC
jgi:tyrosyl-DNA phosphodiesterase 1